MLFARYFANHHKQSITAYCPACDQAKRIAVNLKYTKKFHGPFCPDCGHNVIVKSH